MSTENPRLVAFGPQAAKLGLVTYRKDLILAAVRAFAKRGPEGTTVSDIADEAGVSQPRISQIFGGKDHAWEAAYDWSTRALTDTMTKEFTKTDDLQRVWDATYERCPEEMRVLMHSLSCSLQFPELQVRLRQTLGQLAELGAKHGYSADDVLGLGLLTCAKSSLGVGSLDVLVN